MSIGKRIAPCVLILTTFCSIASAQYVISTAAGGGPPDGLPATSVGIDVTGVTVVPGSTDFYVVGGCRVYKVSGGIEKVVAGDGVCNYFGDGGPAKDAEINAGASRLAVNNAGDLYIVDYNRVRKVSSGIITTVAGTGVPGYSGDGGLATNAQLNQPVDVGLDAAENLYILEQGRVRKVSGGVISTIAGAGLPGYAGDGGPATLAQLGMSAQGIAVSGSGDVYVADTINGRVRKISGGMITTVAGKGWTGGLLGDNGPAVNASLTPQDLTLDAAGNLYILDGSSNSIRKVTSGVITSVIQNVSGFAIAQDANGAILVATLEYVVTKVANGNTSIVAGNGSIGFFGEDVEATSAELGWPLNVATNTAGELYIADKNNNRVRKLSHGMITTVMGDGSGFIPGNPGFSFTTIGVAVDNTETLFIASFDRVLELSGGVITTVAGGNGSGCSGDGGQALDAQFKYISGIALGPGGEVYIVDFACSAVRKISNGVITNLAGTGTVGYSGEGGPASNAWLNYPMGVAVDSSGDVYIADTGNLRIRKVHNGIITTFAGGVAGCSDDGGQALGGAMLSPSAVAFDAADNLYIADETCNQVAKVTSGTIRTIAGTGYYGFTGDGGPATAATVASPMGIAADRWGNVYVATGSVIRELTPISEAVTNPLPVNGATQVLPNVVLQWQPAAGAASYDVYLGATFPLSRVASGSTTASYSPGILIPSTSYYWQIVANSPQGSTSSAVWTFTTIGAPVLSISCTHSGNFVAGQLSAAYTVVVSNSTGGPTSGILTVTETLPTGLTLVSMTGSGWSCTGATCSRVDVLAAGSAYPPITVWVNVSTNATSPVTNTVSVSGGLAVTATGADATTILLAGSQSISIVPTAPGCFTGFVVGTQQSATTWSINPQVGTLYVVTQWIGVTPNAVVPGTDQIDIACYTPATSGTLPQFVTLTAASVANPALNTSVHLDPRTGKML